ncbi:MAG: [FeFe] hydrogenase H-cluster radical SAM maturase HydE [Phycisphaerae bacterium]|nr:[FeFe] hydrogenase H-cluster radical SAM maturase HydE [Phycisphaerae bacterium]
MDRNEILSWLKETDTEKLNELWQKADKVRLENVGPEVHLRGLIEISSYCVRRCGYCGLNADNKLQRYRMTRDEIIECAHAAVEYEYGTVVMQAGEDYGLKTEFIADIVREIKNTTNLAVTLSLGERIDDLAIWREAGADRYLLRFETSNHELYEKIHPSLPNQNCDRFEILKKLGELGYEVGSGVMIGIPGQSYETLATDIETFGKFDLDMIGVGPFISHPDTMLGREGDQMKLPEGQQVPNTEDMVYKVVALTRLMCPQANIPATSALATINTEDGRENGLNRGANIVMPNLTPVKYRAMYEIYPDKACVNETANQCRFCLAGRIESIGRTVGQGQGGRKKII